MVAATTVAEYEVFDEKYLSLITRKFLFDEYCELHIKVTSIIREHPAPKVNGSEKKKGLLSLGVEQREKELLGCVVGVFNLFRTQEKSTLGSDLLIRGQSSLLGRLPGSFHDPHRQAG